jgi:trigger factor
MKCEVKDVNQCCKLLIIDVPQQTINDAYNLFYKQIAPKAKIPGFRPGKAPHEMVSRYYKNEAKEEVLKRLVSDSYHQALIEKKINPLGYPQFEEINFQDDVLIFRARVEIKPEIKIKKYKGITAKRESLVVEESEIDDVITRIRDGHAKFTPVEDRGVELGDFAVCDITNSIEGEASETKKNEWVEIQENDMIKGFATQTVGMKPGESKDIEVVISENFPNEKVRGKKALFNVCLKEIKKKQLPELDGEFLKQLGDYESLELLRAAIKKDIEVRKKEDIDAKIERALLDTIEKDISFDLPQSLVERRLEGLVQDAIQSQMYHGLSKEEAEKNRDEFLVRFKAEAERQVKVAFILDAIGIAESIETADDDVEARFQSLSKQYQQPVEKIKEYYAKNDMIDSLRAEIRNKKVIDFIKENADIK